MGGALKKAFVNPSSFDALQVLFVCFVGEGQNELMADPDLSLYSFPPKSMH